MSSSFHDYLHEGKDEKILNVFRQIRDAVIRDVDELFDRYPLVILAASRELAAREIFDGSEIKLVKSIGRIGAVDICIVNGDDVKNKKFMDFLEGGNDAVYGPKGEVAQFMPDNTVWLAAGVPIEQMRHTLVHELVERAMMVAFNMTYDQAHEVANRVEKEEIR